MVKNSITQERLKELFHYDPEMGVFTRLVRTAYSVRVGDIAGYLNAHGYIIIRIEGKGHRAHRLAFLYMTGCLPEHQTDHINGIRDDNRWVNLRPVTHQENQKNRKKQSTNTSGVTGVYWHIYAKKWIARIKVNGKYKHLGGFNDLDEAVKARKVAEKKYNFHPNHGRRA